jgi:hypothetical protein
MQAAANQDFLNKLFPQTTASVVEDLYTSLKNSGDYCANVMQWKDMPQTPTALDSAHYRPFCDRANAIREQALAYLPGSPKDDFQAAWVDYQSKVPRSAGVDAALIRPDCVLATTSQTITSLEDRISAKHPEMVNSETDSNMLNDLVRQLLQSNYAH